MGSQAVASLNAGSWACTSQLLQANKDGRDGMEAMKCVGNVKPERNLGCFCLCHVYPASRDCDVPASPMWVLWLVTPGTLH